MGGKVLELKTDKLIKEIRDSYKDELKAKIKEEVKQEIKQKVKEEIAIRMLKRGGDILEEIADNTGLPLERIKKITEEQQF